MRADRTGGTREANDRTIDTNPPGKSEDQLLVLSIGSPGGSCPNSTAMNNTKPYGHRRRVCASRRLSVGLPRHATISRYCSVDRAITQAVYHIGEAFTVHETPRPLPQGSVRPGAYPRACRDKPRYTRPFSRRAIRLQCSKCPGALSPVQTQGQATTTATVQTPGTSITILSGCRLEWSRRKTPRPVAAGFLHSGGDPGQPGRHRCRPRLAGPMRSA